MARTGTQTTCQQSGIGIKRHHIETKGRYILYRDFRLAPYVDKFGNDFRKIYRTNPRPDRVFPKQLSAGFTFQSGKDR